MPSSLPSRGNGTLLLANQDSAMRPGTATLGTAVCLPRHPYGLAAPQLPVPGENCLGPVWPWCVAAALPPSPTRCPLQVLELWPGAPLVSLSRTGTRQTRWVHTVLEDADEQGFIGFSVPPVHWDLHIVNVWQQHVQLPVADEV